MERLGGAVRSVETAQLLGDALASLLTGVVAKHSAAQGSRGPRAKLDEVRGGLCLGLA